MLMLNIKITFYFLIKDFYTYFYNFIPHKPKEKSKDFFVTTGIKRNTDTGNTLLDWCAYILITSASASVHQHQCISIRASESAHQHQRISISASASAHQHLFQFCFLFSSNNSQIGWKSSPLERWFCWWPPLTNICASRMLFKWSSQNNHPMDQRMCNYEEANFRS